MTGTSADSIIAALQANRAADADRMCRDYLAAEPGSEDVRVLHAVSLWRLGERDSALEIYAGLTRQFPDSPVHWRNYATALRQSGALEDAERAFAKAVEFAIDDADLLEQYGLLKMELGKPAEARVHLLRAFDLVPDSPSIRIHAAQACAACRDLRADGLVEPWRSWLPLDDGLQAELLELLVQMGEADHAAELLEDLVHRIPAERRLRLRLAALYERVNRLGDAEALLDAVAMESSAMTAREATEISHQRAQLAMRRRQYAEARGLLERAGPHGDGDVAYWFTLAAACDKCGDTDAAMRAVAEAHRRQIEEIRNVVPHYLDADAEVLPNADARVSEADYRAWPTLKSPDASQSPVFVVGFPRSGTTLLEQMLDAHPLLQSMDERPFFNMLAGQLERTTDVRVPEGLGRLDQNDCDELRKGYLMLACGKVARRWDARLVDKNPLNMMWLPLIYRMFPEARFILALRHPCDVILSCYFQNFRAPVLAVAGQSLQQLARAYVAAMDTWLHHVSVFKPEVFVSRYEELVADTPAQTRRIAGFLGLESAESMLQFNQRAREKGYIKTPSYTQVIEPISRSRIGRWERYRTFFEPVLPILQPMLEHWGYRAGYGDTAVET